MPIFAEKDDGVLPVNGTKVKIKDEIAPKEDCGGFLVQQKYIDARRPSEIATYTGWVPGCGGDVWWVTHDDGTVGAYLFNELLVERKAK